MNLEDTIPNILRVNGNEKDPNLQDVPDRDKPKYLREQYWIKQCGPTERWKTRNLVNCSQHIKLRTADLERKLDDPGDAFYELLLSSSQSIINLRTWIEVTEVFLGDEQAKKVNSVVRKYNSLQGKNKIDTDEFLRSLDIGRPDSRMQRKMADKVISAIVKKARKGQEGGSYKSLVRDYGRGQLIVGLPLWFATFPSEPTNPAIVLTDFVPRLLLGFEKIKNSIFLTNWCPFDSIVVLWNPTLESIDEWAKVADLDFYSDPASLSWKTPISPLKFYSFLGEFNLPISNHIGHNIRWDRYSSLNDMLTDQRKWLRFPNNPPPLGPKACLEVNDLENRDSILRMCFYNWLLQLWLFVRINGWCGLQRWVASRFSIRRLYTRMRRRHQARKLYRSSFSNHSRSNDNDCSDEFIK